MNKKGKIVLGILGAAAAGAVIGLLIAPDKGSGLRKKIAKAANDFACDLTDMVMSNRDKLSHAKDQIVKEAKGLKSDAETRFGRVKESFS
ncbi:MAG TPA: YtxH domain-containing protein [Ohtaekwangia sp.]|uniref:YtxH domain-containing protein n=1 Tax=Ohtaekwangia sp. TaxID=2066019 RepID=UPI002F920432